MALSKDQIFNKLKERYASENQKLLNEVAYNLSLASTNENTLEERAAKALQALRARATMASPLEQTATKKEKTSLSVCPICKCGMRTVKLIEDRDAFYCPDHRIVVPFPSISDDEADL